MSMPVIGIKEIAMKFLKPALMAACFFVTANAVADNAHLRSTLEERMPGVKIGQINAGPMPGLFEVVVNGINVMYTDKNGDLAFFGNVVNLKTTESITRKRSEELAFVDFSKIPLTQAIVKVKGDGSRKLVVFSDPDCPYCKQLEKDLAFLDNVTIYTMLYPLEELHPGARKKSEAVWCASDRTKAWDDLMLYGKEPAAATGECKTPIDEIHKLAEQLYISGTPGLVFQNGKLVPGGLKTEQIEELLKAATKS
jgi:thiol:disulfide interchange protein DsbC